MDLLFNQQTPEICSHIYHFLLKNDLLRFPYLKQKEKALLVKLFLEAFPNLLIDSLEGISFLEIKIYSNIKESLTQTQLKQTLCLESFVTELKCFMQTGKIHPKHKKAYSLPCFTSDSIKESLGIKTVQSSRFIPKF